MQLLVYSKNNPDPTTPVIRNYMPSQLVEMKDEISSDGTVSLMSVASFQELTDHLEKLDTHNCGIKKDMVELYRSLHFHKKGIKKVPRRLVFYTDEIGGLKRSLARFMSRRYKETDPACWILTSESMLELMLNDPLTAEKRKPPKEVKDLDDPIALLLQETASDPVILDVEKVYIGSSSDMRLARLMILKAARSTSPVLILGESGTGKDVIARQIGKFSKSYKKSFATVNCAALPEALLEGELFGYMKGIFSGAVTDKIGLFEEHIGGTVFLDEIGDLSLANQAKLLLAIDSKQIRPIGSNKSRNADVRIIAATNRNIDHMAMYGHFREDLLHRLNVLRIYAPPLRSHPEDVPAIADHIWKKLNPGGKLSAEFQQYLVNNPWPGNVRELKSLLTSIMDLFGAISPTPAHVDAIRNTRRNLLLSTIDNPANEQDKMLKLESKVRLTQLQNIIRGIKVTLRPVINKELTQANYIPVSEKIRHYISLQLALIDNICLEPVYLKEMDLFKMTTRYRYLLDKLLKRWPGTRDELFKSWTDELKDLDENITRIIMELMWGKIDM